VAGREDLGAESLRLEERYLGLRTSDGVAAGALPAAAVDRWRAAGWAVGTDRVRLTPEGWLRLDALVAALP
jgi:hypothetical protein